MRNGQSSPTRDDRVPGIAPHKKQEAAPVSEGTRCRAPSPPGSFQTRLSKEKWAAMSVGGLTPERKATPEIQAIADQMKSQLEGEVNENFAIFQAICYRSQVVAGANFFIKVQIGHGVTDYVHLRIFQALPVYGGQCKLSGYQMHKTRDDPIIYF
uniref:Leukocyte cysteine proteinase inhibitor 1-like n=1 Tax=Pogona vitticeps TaxID=103695 RepID=A0A6J0TKK8_9SAUR|nr:leukocyte cysteine proteinase inhibitor 1-like [Pogona vitticeps]